MKQQHIHLHLNLDNQRPWLKAKKGKWPDDFRKGKKSCHRGKKHFHKRRGEVDFERLALKFSLTESQIMQLKESVNYLAVEKRLGKPKQIAKLLLRHNDLVNFLASSAYTLPLELGQLASVAKSDDSSDEVSIEEEKAFCATSSDSETTSVVIDDSFVLDDKTKARLTNLLSKRAIDASESQKILKQVEQLKADGFPQPAARLANLLIKLKDVELVKQKLAKKPACASKTKSCKQVEVMTKLCRQQALEEEETANYIEFCQSLQEKGLVASPVQALRMLFKIGDQALVTAKLEKRAQRKETASKTKA